MKFRSSGLALLTLFLLSAFLTGQEKASKIKGKKNEPKPVEVKVNVLVKDVSGNLVNDVKAENLKIFEDGVEQKITYFTQKEPVLNLMLVVDNSGSMRKNLDEILKLGSVFGDIFLTDKNEVFVIRFVSSSKIQILQDWTSSKKDLNEAIDEMYVEGGQSAILDAIYLSAEVISETEKKARQKRHAILLISDGEDRDSYYKFDETLVLFKDSDAQVFLLSFAETAPRDKKGARQFSRLITLETGGTVYSLPKKFTRNDIINSLKSIAEELRSQYIVGYTSTNQKRDGLTRKLTLEVADNEKGEKRRGSIRESFDVPKEK